MNVFQQPEAVRAALEPLLDQIRTVGDPHEREKAAEMNRLLQRLPSALTNISELLEIERKHQRSCLEIRSRVAPRFSISW